MWNAGEKKVTIGLDYDDTYTADPELWQAFVANARARGHKIIVVSCRRDSIENRQEMDVPGALTYLTGGSPKQWYMRERGVEVDIWIDDNPDCVLNGR